MQDFFILGVIAVWLLILTGFLIYIYNFFRKLTRGVSQENLISTLKSVLKKETDNTKEIDELKKYLENLDHKGKLHLQKIGYLRFNPFQEMGGDHSFSVSLLDDHDTGIVITGLHARDRTRVYVKEIKKGKSKVDLSKEEKKAISLAQN
jgi:hypothetical protein